MSNERHRVSIPLFVWKLFRRGKQDSSVLLALYEAGNLTVTWDSSHKDPVVQTFDDFFVTLNRLLHKQSSCQWFETLDLAQDLTETMLPIPFNYDTPVLMDYWNDTLLQPFSFSFISNCTGPSLVQVVVCRLFGSKPLPEQMLTYCQLKWPSFGSELSSL